MSLPAGRASLETLLHAFYINEGILVTPFHTMLLMCPATSDRRCARHTRSIRGFHRSPAQGRSGLRVDGATIRSFGKGRHRNRRRPRHWCRDRHALRRSRRDGRRRQQTRDIAEELARRACRARSDASHCVPFESLDRASLRDTVDRVAGKYGRLDIVVHNAGGCPWASLEELDEAKLDATLALNLNACFWLAQAAIPHMRARGFGRILVTSSVSARFAMGGGVHYSAAKAGVNAFIRGAAFELARDGITVNGVEAGFIAKPGRGTMSTPENMARIASTSFPSAGWAMPTISPVRCSIWRRRRRNTSPARPSSSMAVRHCRKPALRSNGSGVSNDPLAARPHCVDHRSRDRHRSRDGRIFAKNGALVVLFGLGDAELDAAAAEAGGEAIPSDVTESADIVRATRLQFYALML